ncbi:hypothetical protein B0A55_00342 [Friedmanniomyces simplex]|uniref:Large ribosomal subunit protein bL28m n=1 Tax=Friedmanniomyces simplex TaxID=329884 RepID=A0A4V5NIK9_9PEZI|nr:hypothetical protein B0A55_00342 [Friedmanniomyces simplex]
MLRIWLGAQLCGDHERPFFNHQHVPSIMASLFRTRPRPHTVTYCRRAFSTTPSPAVSLQLEKNDPEAVADALPLYPYGPTRWYKQSSLGLYGGQRIRFGNNVGEKFENKTRRSWHPNVLTRKLFSNALDRVVQVRVTTRVLRTIDKLGGLDEYLLGEKEARIKELGESGWWLRWAIMQTSTVKARFAEERRRLGMSEEVALQEEEEVAKAQSVIEEAVAEISEPVGTDGAFQVEQPPGVPPLKFRVGPGKHLVLTADGWRRTRPDPARLPKIAKSRMAKEYECRLFPKREQAVALRLATRQVAVAVAEPQDRLSAEEQAQILKEARQGWRKQLKAKVERIYNLKVAQREKNRAERRSKKREAGKAERERRAVAVVEE